MRANFRIESESFPTVITHFVGYTRLQILLSGLVWLRSHEVGRHLGRDADVKSKMQSITEKRLRGDEIWVEVVSKL
jgi:hypothetical protein